MNLKKKNDFQKKFTQRAKKNFTKRMTKKAQKGGDKKDFKSSLLQEGGQGYR